VFRSLTFSGVNMLTLLLYGALGGAMFFLPFLLIQVHGYSPPRPVPHSCRLRLSLPLLSRWGGGLVDRFGGRLPLIVGPVVVAVGFFSAEHAGYRRYLLDDVPAADAGPGTWNGHYRGAADNHRVEFSGPASDGGCFGINNAVAQVASLLMIAILGTVGIATLNRSLDQHLAIATPAPMFRISSITRARAL